MLACRLQPVEAQLLNDVHILEAARAAEQGVHNGGPDCSGDRGHLHMSGDRMRQPSRSFPCLARVLGQPQSPRDCQRFRASPLARCSGTGNGGGHAAGNPSATSAGRVQAIGGDAQLLLDVHVTEQAGAAVLRLHHSRPDGTRHGGHLYGKGTKALPGVPCNVTAGSQISCWGS
jgi:hypothetical protein